MRFPLTASDVRHHSAQPARRPAIEPGLFRAVILDVNLPLPRNGQHVHVVLMLPDLTDAETEVIVRLLRQAIDNVGPDSVTFIVDV
jgi:hypothetical protein